METGNGVGCWKCLGSGGFADGVGPWIGARRGVGAGPWHLPLTGSAALILWSEAGRAARGCTAAPAELRVIQSYPRPSQAIRGYLRVSDVIHMSRCDILGCLGRLRDKVEADASAWRMLAVRRAELRDADDDNDDGGGCGGGGDTDARRRLRRAVTGGGGGGGGTRAVRLCCAVAAGSTRAAGRPVRGRGAFATGA
jgi:hypothetical protein